VLLPTREEDGLPAKEAPPRARRGGVREESLSCQRKGGEERAHELTMPLSKRTERGRRSSYNPISFTKKGRPNRGKGGKGKIGGKGRKRGAQLLGFLRAPQKKDDWGRVEDC